MEAFAVEEARNLARKKLFFSTKKLQMILCRYKIINMWKLNAN